MAERKQKTSTVEVSPPEDAVSTEPENKVFDVQEHIQKTVEAQVQIYTQQRVQELEQRITDLELLVGQPQGAVNFVGVADVPNYTDKDNVDGEVPWYQP